MHEHPSDLSCWWWSTQSVGNKPAEQNHEPVPSVQCFLWASIDSNCIKRWIRKGCLVCKCSFTAWPPNYSLYWNFLDHFLNVLREMIKQMSVIQMWKCTSVLCDCLYSLSYWYEQSWYEPSWLWHSWNLETKHRLVQRKFLCDETSCSADTAVCKSSVSKSTRLIYMSFVSLAT